MACYSVLKIVHLVFQKVTKTPKKGIAYDDMIFYWLDVDK